MLFDELRSLFLFEGLPDDDLARLASLGEEIRFAPGEVLFEQGRPAVAWWVLLEGRLELLRRVAREESVAGVVDQPGRWTGGFRAWSSEAGYLTTGRGASEGRMFTIPSDALGAWAREVLPLGAHFITGFFESVRAIEATASQRESLVALGTLAAGLAHELNNPAAATAHAAGALRDATDGLHRSLAELAERSPTAAQFRAMDALRLELDTAASPSGALARSEREEELGSWLARHGVGSAWELAPTLTEAGADASWLERMLTEIGDEGLEPALGWVAASLSTSSILDQLEDATSRISSLVGAVGSYTQLDRATMQLVDVTEGLDSTLVMLGHRLRPGVTVVRGDAEDVARIEANAAELNQVWTNLIDNAIDAMDGTGTLTVTTRADGDDVVVEITDDGAGMSADVAAHAFDPFFTTKEVGKGTGLGLDICRRIVVEQHHGDISIDSRPGRTVLRVRLPRTQTDRQEPARSPR